MKKLPIVLVALILASALPAEERDLVDVYSYSVGDLAALGDPTVKTFSAGFIVACVGWERSLREGSLEEAVLQRVLGYGGDALAGMIQKEARVTPRKTVLAFVEELFAKARLSL